MNMHPGHHALRTGRVSLTGQVYLITTTTAGRQPLFGEWVAASAACRALTQPVLWRASSLLGWVLMPDHWHALVQLGDADTLPGLLNRVKSASARSVNAVLHRKGKVWSKAFHDHGLRAEDDLLATARYVIANPLRAGLARSVRAYPYWDAVWLQAGNTERADACREDRPHGGLLQAPETSTPPQAVPATHPPPVGARHAGDQTRRKRAHA